MKLDAVTCYLTSKVLTGGDCAGPRGKGVKHAESWEIGILVNIGTVRDVVSDISLFIRMSGSRMGRREENGEAECV